MLMCKLVSYYIYIYAADKWSECVFFIQISQPFFLLTSPADYYFFHRLLVSILFHKFIPKHLRSNGLNFLIFILIIESSFSFCKKRERPYQGWMQNVLGGLVYVRVMNDAPSKIQCYCMKRGEKICLMIHFILKFG